VNAANTSAKKEDISFEGSPKEVADAAQVALELMNISFLPSKGTPIRLVGSSNGTTFALIFEGRKVAGVQKTAVRIEWIKGVDERFWMDFIGTMMTALESQQRKGRQASN
jgi:hypothetical protein